MQDAHTLLPKLGSSRFLANHDDKSADVTRCAIVEFLDRRALSYTGILLGGRAGTGDSFLSRKETGRGAEAIVLGVVIIEALDLWSKSRQTRAKRRGGDRRVRRLDSSSCYKAPGARNLPLNVQEYYAIAGSNEVCLPL
jgi:hypothetical protein